MTEATTPSRPRPSIGRAVRPTAGVALGLALALSALSASASTPSCDGASARDAERDFVVLDQALGDAVRDIGQVMGTPVAVSKRVEGRITGRRWRERPCALLDALAREYALQLYSDGLTLHVTTAAEAETVMIVLTHASAVELARRLTELQISDVRYPLRTSEDGQIVRVSGPPRFVALVKEAAAAIEHASAGRAPMAGVTRAAGWDIVRGYTLEGVEP